MVLIKTIYFICPNTWYTRPIKYKIEAKSDDHAKKLLKEIHEYPRDLFFKNAVLEKHTITMGQKIEIKTEVLL